MRARPPPAEGLAVTMRLGTIRTWRGNRGSDAPRVVPHDVFARHVRSRKALCAIGVSVAILTVVVMWLTAVLAIAASELW
jgi:hypothetical protein